MAPAGEVLVLPFYHTGHTFPAIELSQHLAARGLAIVLFLRSPPRSHLHDNVRIIQFAAPPPPTPRPPEITTGGLRPPPPPQHLRRDAAVEEFLAGRSSTSPPLLCAIVDEMMSGYIDLCESLKVPVVSFFTSSACAAALDHAASASPGQDLPRLLEVMNLSASDLIPRPPPHGGAASPPPPRGLEGTNKAVGLLFNTCDALERPFLDYVEKASGSKPVWAVGPLLAGDGDRRPEQGPPLVTAGEIRQWLDSKPASSVVYVSFGTLVLPEKDELEELAAALEKSGKPFIWALAEGNFSPEMKVELERGLVLRGFAPQLKILGHPSTAAFISHCGWNSTLEALTRGVPILAWPVKGDQIYNAGLLTSRLGVGHVARVGDMGRSIELLVSDQAVKARAAGIRSVFEAGFPTSSAGSLDRLVDFIRQLTSV